MTDVVFTSETAEAFFREGERLRADAEQSLKEARQEREAARYDLGQADRRLRDVQALEKSIALREQHLRESNEAQLLERERLADEKLKQAQGLMARYDKDRHAAMLVLTKTAA